MFLLAEHLERKIYKGKIIAENEPIQKLYMIKEGTITCKRKDMKKSKTLTTDQYFGSVQLFVDPNNNKSFYSYFAEEEVEIYEITYYKLSELLGNEFRVGIVHEMFLRAMKGSEKIIDLLLDDVQMISSMFKIRYYANPDIVYYCGNKKHKKVTVIICGRLIKNNETVANQEELFGEFILDSKEKY
jgi:signal-transduction protein with cAMP-binding, CBS, and nucleotidyltransferase domain